MKSFDDLELLPLEEPESLFCQVALEPVVEPPLLDQPPPQPSSYLSLFFNWIPPLLDQPPPQAIIV